MKLLLMCAFLLCHLFPSSGWTQTGCNATGFEYEDDLIKIVNYDCLAGGLCNVNVELPRAIGEAKFLGLTLHRGENETTDFFVKVGVRKNGESLRSQIFGTEEYLETLDLRVTYSGVDECAIYGKKQLKHNKKRNEVDGTVVPPIR